MIINKNTFYKQEGYCAALYLKEAKYQIYKSMLNFCFKSKNKRLLYARNILLDFDYRMTETVFSITDIIYKLS